MSVKEAVHKLVDEMPDDAPELLDFYERLRLNRAIAEARQSIREGRYYTLEEVERMTEERWETSHSA